VLKSRIITAVILLFLLLLALFALPAGGWIALVLLIMLQGVREWSTLASLSDKGTYFYTGVTFLLVMAQVLFDAYHVRSHDAHLYVYAVSALLWLVIVPVWMWAGWKIENRLLMCLVGWAVLLPTGLAMLELRAASPVLLLVLMSLVWTADIGAYFTGRRFGKRKLAPSISPGKTWEGVAGGMLGVSLYVLLIWYWHPFAALPVLMLAGGFWTALSVTGDLFESLMKRQAGVKDSGTLLPGHGGLLDRIDALTSTLPLAALVILLQHIV
jgi:phosphatidate cytidylyltransferase